MGLALRGERDLLSTALQVSAATPIAASVEALRICPGFLPLFSKKGLTISGNKIPVKLA